VLLSIADRAGEDHTAYPSVARLADDTEMDRKTVMSCIGYLIEKGIIEASKRNGARTTYRLVGVEDRHQTSTKNGTSPKIGTGTKNGTGPVPKTGPVPVPNLGHEPISNQPLTNQRDCKPTTARFIKPTVEEVDAHIREKGYTFTAAAFIANYEAKGWKIGSSPMKSWKAACTTWQIRENERGNAAHQQQPVRKKKTFDELLAGGAS